MSDAFDIVIIGGGPAGYTGAIRAAQLGFTVACIEKRATLGGTCLNVGCIPSKALLQSSEKFEETKHALAAHGVKVGGVELDLKTMLARKDKVVLDLTQGIKGLFKKNKVTWVEGAGTITAPGKVQVALSAGGTKELDAKHIIIATGSDVIALPGIEIDETQIVSSTGALNLAEVPKHLVVVGGGVIGLELGSVWRRLGAEVTVIEFLDKITPTMDGELGKQLQRTLTKQGFKFMLSTKVVAATRPPSPPMSCLWRLAAVRLPTAWGSRRSASRSILASALPSMAISRQIFPASTLWATSSPGRCSPIRRRKRSSCWSSPWPGRSRI